jgi:hypothetical protein
MIKHVEDKINVENDTEYGMVRVILLVEDSAKYYSRYLPMLYHIVLEQTKRIIDDVSTDELYKILRLRARPKILMVESYEDAVAVMERFKDYLLCLISDVKFNRNGQLDERAGIDLVEFTRRSHKDLPIILQSSEEENAKLAYQLKCTFINKNSETLSQDFRSFITHFLGFGNFIYRNEQGVKIAEARSLKEFEKLLRSIPDESLLYHAKRDHFSLWLMARGEILAAKILNPHKVTDFENAVKIREYLIDVISKFRNEQNQGKIIPFEESALMDETNIVSLMDGYLGGKGRGLAFVNTLIYNFDFTQQIPNIKILAPKTSVIGTEEFEYFMDRNQLRDFVAGTTDYEEIKKKFMEAKLTDTLIKRMKALLTKITRPIAVRSSGLFEDSLMQPFAGIFETYLLPNCHPDLNERLKQALDAIKLVFASIYSPEARGYIEAVHYKIEEEKMAVVIQEVAGRQYGNYFYPHISGVAQSYNFYPYAHMQPEEGFAVMAVGLGKSVVDGERAYRFSPKYPSTEILSPKDQSQNTQVDFYAVDLNKKDINLLEGDTAGLAKLDVYEAEMHGNLRHCASVYDADSLSIIPGITHPGPRVINFANILKYNYIPLAQAIEVVLDVVKEAMGSPVEIEFAVDLTKDKQNRATFYLLQIKPLIGSSMDYNVDLAKIPKESILLYAEKSMGNGLIENINDIIFVDIDVFDKGDTVQMTYEIEKLNKMFAGENKKYLLIGPGRWGTRDRWIGIPVNWAQISHAKVIIETSLEGYPLDASSGSHFFHNVVSMNVGYFSIQPEMSKSFIRWDVLKKQKVINETKYFRHVRFDKPLVVSMDGKKRISVITPRDIMNNEFFKGTNISRQFNIDKIPGWIWKDFYLVNDSGSLMHAKLVVGNNNLALAYPVPQRIDVIHKFINRRNISCPRIRHHIRQFDLLYITGLEGEGPHRAQPVPVAGDVRNAVGPEESIYVVRRVGRHTSGAEIQRIRIPGVKEITLRAYAGRTGIIPVTSKIEMGAPTPYPFQQIIIIMMSIWLRCIIVHKNKPRQAHSFIIRNIIPKIQPVDAIIASSGRVVLTVCIHFWPGEDSDRLGRRESFITFRTIIWCDVIFIECITIIAKI